MSEPKKKIEHVRDVPVGLLRIYFRQGAKMKHKGLWKRLNTPPDYLAIIRAAKRHEIPIGKVKGTMMGYLEGDPLQDNAGEAPNPRLPVYVELIGDRESLVKFCEAESELLHNKQLFFTELHRWELVEGAPLE